MHFPTVKASNLSGREFSLPTGFEGEWNVAALAFQMWHQKEVDTWMPLRFPKTSKVSETKPI